MDKIMLIPRQIIFNSIRTFINRRDPKKWEADGQKYGLITYYPRHPNHVDPPIKPSKLFMVERVKPVAGNPLWEKKILKKYNIFSKKQIKQTTIVKNTPEVNFDLWKIKHLIKVTPIELPDKLPDINEISSYLHDNGKLLIFPKLDEKRVKATEEFINDPKRMDGDTLHEHLRLQWLNPMI